MSKTTERIEKQEDIDFTILKWFLEKKDKTIKVNKSKEKSVYDATVETEEGNRYLIEIKHRFIDIDKYDDFLLSYHKITDINAKLKEGEKAYLCAIYPNEKKLAFWNLTDIEPEKTTKWVKKTEYAEDTYRRQEEFALLPFKDAKIYNYGQKN